MTGCTIIVCTIITALCVSCTQDETWRINLRDYPAYIKVGFDFEIIKDLSNQNTVQTYDDQWSIFEPTPSHKAIPLIIANTDLKAKPSRVFLSPRKRIDQEWTIVIPFMLEKLNADLLLNQSSKLPGLFFSGIGDNWEIFVNGVSVQAQLHRSKDGTINSHRVYRNVYFPLNPSFLRAGTNTIALRIIGDPTYISTGLFYASEYYLGFYDSIVRRSNEMILYMICGVFIFLGAYHFLLYSMRMDEKYNCYFGIFSALLGIYFFTRTNFIYRLFPDTNITTRIEYASLYLLPSLIFIFLNYLNYRKTLVVTKVYMGICAALALSQFFFSLQYTEDTLVVFQVLSLFFTLYLYGYTTLYVFIRDGYRQWKMLKSTGKTQSLCTVYWTNMRNTILGNFIIITTMLFLSGLAELVALLFFEEPFGFLQYAFFIFVVAAAFILARQFGDLYNQLRQSKTDLEKTVTELEKQTQAALAASQSKTTFLATMSHEIRTPLNAVIGLTDIELRKTLPAETFNNLKKIRVSGTNLLGIINDILDISKIESHNFELVQSEYCTSSLINDTVQLNILRIGNKPITFDLTIDETLPVKLYGDELRIKQIFNNLLSNAFKYTKEGTVSMNVSHTVKGNETLLSMSVKDTGIGIRSGDLERLFSDYTQVDLRAHHAIEGTGLGLSISKRLVELMEGIISVTSEYGRGSCFTVTFPQSIVDSTGIGKKTVESIRHFQWTEEKQEKIETYTQMPDRRVLVVDDVEINLEVAKGIMEVYGFTIDCVTSGRQAIDLIQSAEQHYDAVFMDHMMPEMDGIEATQYIRQKIGTDYARTVPIIALTANALIGNEDNFLANGFTAFLSKPLDPHQLDEVVNKYVKGER
ncbi:MAG: response regulator [Spirochaetaceae bacterium]|jgi:signal transduction histidine kinase/CheY-like chemotaxis protein|nr:response regulator [Spirochaetaceae bacterium]